MTGGPERWLFIQSAVAVEDSGNTWVTLLPPIVDTWAVVLAELAARA
ncbi:hypothetical protein [Limnoglobus roseus]|nr:hypothetical protein [Limnoglobus roseus]